ncbi:MAG: hypothetical protein V7637_5141 [Mycobacteriales bacterium]
MVKRRVLTPVSRRVALLRSRGTAPAPSPQPRSPADDRPSSGSAAAPAQFEFGIDEFSYYRGTLHVEGWVASADHIVGVGYLAATGQAVRAVAFPTSAPGERQAFQFDVHEENRDRAVEQTLTVEFSSGTFAQIPAAAGSALSVDPVSALTRRFHDEVNKMDAPRVLEVGSRARSGNVYSSLFPPESTYVGCDILPGENVDVVGDAHQLSTFLPLESFDAIYSVSTMEHLAMPWVVAAEMNRVLRPGGYVYVVTHQTWPVHDAPWDFYRFSQYAWVTLFNRYSGFEIVAVAAGEPGKVVANILHPSTNGLELQPAFLSSAVLARKVAPTELVWAADASAVVADAYPA